MKLNAIVLIADDVSVTGIAAVFASQPHGNPETQRFWAWPACVHGAGLQRCTHWVWGPASGTGGDRPAHGTHPVFEVPGGTMS